MEDRQDEMSGPHETEILVFVELLKREQGGEEEEGSNDGPEGIY